MLRVNHGVKAFWQEPVVNAAANFDDVFGGDLIQSGLGP